MDDNFTASETTALTTSALDTPNNITLPKLEEEIKYHLNQISQNIIEVGKRLIQAKDLVQHGQWQHWLNDNFQLTDRTARRFMQISERFSKTVDVDRFKPSQLTELLALPDAKETEKFIAEKAAAGTPVADMSIKTLRKEIKQWKTANKEITPSDSTGNEESETIDSTPNAFPQKQDESISSVPSEQDTTSLVNPEPPEQSHTDFQQPYPETQSYVDETLGKYNYREPILLETPTEIPGTYLIEEILSMCDSLIRHENQDEIIRTFAKNNPDQFNRGIQNLTTIISKLQAIKKN